MRLLRILKRWSEKHKGYKETLYEGELNCATPVLKMVEGAPWLLLMKNESGDTFHLELDKEDIKRIVTYSTFVEGGAKGRQPGLYNDQS